MDEKTESLLKALSDHNQRVFGAGIPEEPEWQTENERTVEWNRKQTEHLKARLANDSLQACMPKCRVCGGSLKPEFSDLAEKWPEPDLCSVCGKKK